MRTKRPRGAARGRSVIAAAAIGAGLMVVIGLWLTVSSLPKAGESENVKGSPTAPVLVEEWSDFQ